MANVNIMIKTINFDFSDPDVTEVTVTIEHDDYGSVLMKNRYSKTFPARLSAVDIMEKHMFGESSYLFW